MSDGQNIKITIGPSESYDPNEPLCLPEIDDIQRKEGLQDYFCTRRHSGKYVKISKDTKDNEALAICEVKVFTLPEGKFL